MGSLIKLLISFGPQLLEWFKVFQKAAPQPQRSKSLPKTAGEMVKQKEEQAASNDAISLKDYLTASGKYPNRETHEELTEYYKNNAKLLLKKVNSLLRDLGITDVKVSSGFRPTAVNANIKGAAKKSLHMTCQAIDIVDPNNSLDKLLEDRDDLLKKYGLWLESPTKTPGWAHLDMKDRGKRAKNIFLP